MMTWTSVRDDEQGSRLPGMHGLNPGCAKCESCSGKLVHTMNTYGIRPGRVWTLCMLDRVPDSWPTMDPEEILCIDSMQCFWSVRKAE